MKFKAKPRINEKRVVIKFAFFPKLIGNLDGGRYVWLERYESHQKYFAYIYDRVQWNEQEAIELKGRV